MPYRLASLLCLSVLFLSLGMESRGDPAGDLSAKQRPLRLGGVAYSPDAVTVWKGIRVYFARNNMPIEFVVYSNYDGLIRALRDGQVDIAWNSPLAHARFHPRVFQFLDRVRR